MPQYPAYSQGGSATLVASVTATDASVQMGGTASNPTVGAEGALRHILCTLGMPPLGGQGSQGPAVANDCAFMAVMAPESDTWKTLELQTGSTWASTASAMDVGLYDVLTGTRLWAYGIDQNGGTAPSEHTLLGNSASTLVDVPIAGGAGVSVAAGQLIYVAVYMVSTTDGLRGTNTIPNGLNLYGVNNADCLAFGKLSGQTKCPASITAAGASLSGSNVAFMVNVRNW